MKGVLTRNKDVLLLAKDSENGSFKLSFVPVDVGNILKITIAGNGKVCAVRGTHTSSP